MSNTIVITLDEDVAEFLDLKVQQGVEANTYINTLLQQEKERRQAAAKARQEVDKAAEVRRFIAQANKSPDDFE